LWVNEQLGEDILDEMIDAGGKRRGQQPGKLLALVDELGGSEKGYG
jgi:hypothetical protein